MRFPTQVSLTVSKCSNSSAGRPELAVILNFEIRKQTGVGFPGLMHELWSQRTGTPLRDREVNGRTNSRESLFSLTAAYHL